MDLTTQLKVVLGAKRTVAYDPKNPWNARDISQVKPNWMTLLKEGILLALAGVLVLIYSLRRVIDVRGGTSREEFGHLSTTTSKGQ